MTFAALKAAVKRRDEALAIRGRGKVRVDVHRAIDPPPAWPEKRVDDVWLVLDDGAGGAAPTDQRITRFYQPPPTLARFQDGKARSRVVVGPVGSGKSSSCVAELLRRACLQAPGPDGLRHTRFAVVRATYRELRDTTRRTFEEWIPPQLGTWREVDFAFRMAFGDVRSEFMFRALDRPEDVKKLLSLELTGAYINELRELPKAIFDGLTARVGRFPSMVQGGPTWRGIIGDSNPWHPTHWAARLFKPEDSRFCLYRQPGGRSPEAENIRNLDRDYYADLMAGKSREWVQVYVDALDSDGAQGSVYGALLSALRSRGGVSAFEHEGAETFTVWDLGIGDATSILWFAINEKRGIDLIDWYESSGQPLSHYLAVVDGKPYEYTRHFLPHDARARTLQTGRSTLELMLNHWPGKVSLVPGISVDQGIEAARYLLEQPDTRIHSRCDVVPPDKEFSGLGLLGEYKYEFDEATKVFSRKPLHDFASHTADAFRYLACVVQRSEMITRKPVKEALPGPNETIIARNGQYVLNIPLDRLHEDRERWKGRRQRL